MVIEIACGLRNPRTTGRSSDHPIAESTCTETVTPAPPSSGTGEELGGITLSNAMVSQMLISVTSPQLTAQHYAPESAFGPEVIPMGGGRRDARNRSRATHRPGPGDGVGDAVRWAAPDGGAR